MGQEASFLSLYFGLGGNLQRCTLELVNGQFFMKGQGVHLVNHIKLTVLSKSTQLPEAEVISLLF